MKKAGYYQISDGKQYVNYSGEYIDAKYIPYTVGSDYSGGSVTLCNYREIRKRLARFAGVYDVSGGYGTYGLAYVEKELTRKGKEIIAEILDSLESYPCYDDDALSMLEWELIQAEFDGNFKYSGLDDSLKEKARQWVVNNIGDRVIIETGATVYIPWEELKAGIVE